ncbi:CheY-like chemotaxis protein/signal transduction histidine kinase [Paraburkholderia bannensis]|uniref:histidine kinase n=1 Tax=Paraburkholderia bannensis TaxID=765414 RepID=A0A7W9TXR5_9BURK|nr:MULTISPECIES: hybrid sensor histidine kinase/response regulator [Paraburkholderia]MBB3257329.1 CheY-like chemotaxis protein/signal transduction histidine kinase [Paraburkholderia sp. WP4_3_2]MBB6102275.1 CheY-like chemotaxis protein/signal transduction histidine kinase [Paraburkholderia bannensis]
MRAIAGGARLVMQRIRDAYHVSDYSVLAVGVIGTFGHPLYWVWWTFIDPQPNESALMRLIGSLASLLLLLRRFWPASLKRFLPWYYFGTVAYSLPFFFTYYLLAGHYSMLWSMAELGMVFFLIAIFPSYIALTVNLAIGIGFAIVCVAWRDPSALQIDSHLLLYVYLPVFAFGIGAGITFCHSNMKGITAQAKSEALRALAGTIAHEMRNPLSQLRYVLDRIDDGLAGMDVARDSPAQTSGNLASLSQHLAHGQIAIDRGLRIIAMTLDEVSAKPLRADKVSYLSAAATTRKALDEYGFSDARERARVSLVVIEDFIFGVDETVYLFTLFNLIRNALHHMTTRQSAKLTITVDQHVVTVHDTGPGIAPEAMAHLFAPFRTHGNAAGTGLGLAYCQRAMRSFGGTITCASEVDKFTQFTLTFPPVAESKVADQRQQVLARAAEFFAGKRVLIVDDDESQRARAALAFTGVHALVSEAESGEAAIAMLQQGPTIDLVIMDINMPGIDGYTATEAIRAGGHETNANVPIVAWSVEPPGVAAMLARNAGMDDMISKSSSAIEFLTLLQSIMESGARNSKRARFDGFAGRLIVLADDDTYSRLIAKSYLERCGAQVLEAEHGQQVLDLLKTGRTVDAVVIDLNMPGMDGLETARLIRRMDGANAKLPIVALTGQSDVEALRACLAAGMNEVMVKPVRVGALYASLSRQFAHTRGALARPTAAAPQQPMARKAANAPAVPKAPAPPIAEAAQIADEDLLDALQLDELASLGLLDPSFLKGIAQIRALIGEIGAHARAHDGRALHHSMHILLGVSGNIGAKALHSFARRLYPEMQEGSVPTEAGWLEALITLGTRSADALQAYFVVVTGFGDSRRTFADD